MEPGLLGEKDGSGLRQEMHVISLEHHNIPEIPRVPLKVLRSQLVKAPTGPEWDNLHMNKNNWKGSKHMNHVENSQVHK